jgi:hypothetical protein
LCRTCNMGQASPPRWAIQFARSGRTQRTIRLIRTVVPPALGSSATSSTKVRIMGRSWPRLPPSSAADGFQMLPSATTISRRGPQDLHDQPDLLAFVACRPGERPPHQFPVESQRLRREPAGACPGSGGRPPGPRQASIPAPWRRSRILPGSGSCRSRLALDQQYPVASRLRRTEHGVQLQILCPDRASFGP